jgi:hypothetical protein
MKRNHSGDGTIGNVLAHSRNTTKMAISPIDKLHFRLSEGNEQTEQTSLVSLRTPWSD